MKYQNRRYLVIPTSLTGSIDFNQIHETSIETLRLSVDKTKTFVKYDVTEISASYTESFENFETGEIVEYIIEQGIYGRPSIYSDEFEEYTHPQILELLSTSEWTIELN